GFGGGRPGCRRRGGPAPTPGRGSASRREFGGAALGFRFAVDHPVPPPARCGADHIQGLPLRGGSVTPPIRGALEARGQARTSFRRLSGAPARDWMICLNWLILLEI